MLIELPYGKTSIPVRLPDRQLVDIITPPTISAASDPQKETEIALENLLGQIDWSQFKEAKSIAIAINDKTRPVPHQHMLPPLLNKLKSLGFPENAITFYLSVGTHLPMPENEFQKVLPASIINRYSVISHNAKDKDQLLYLGATSRATPIWVNKRFAHSDFRIVVGNIEPHQFAGFSGGVKTAAIGLTGMDTINKNHSLLSHPGSSLGKYTNNPLREDIEEIGQKIGIHLALNAILNQEKQIVHVFAGNPKAVMQTGVPLSKQASQAVVPQPYKVMISSPGGYPKDINFYQAQKGLAHTAKVTQPGGKIILAAACSEGFGSSHCETWMKDKQNYQEVIQGFIKGGFRVGPHKAYLIAREASKIDFHLYSEMDRKISEKMLLNPINDLQEAIDNACMSLTPSDRIGVLLHAASTIPYLDEERGI